MVKMKKENQWWKIRVFRLLNFWYYDFRLVSFIFWRILGCQTEWFSVHFMLNRINFSIINGEWRSGKSPRHLHAFYFLGEGWVGRPSQRSAHCVEGRIMITMPPMLGRFTTLLCCLKRPFSWSVRAATSGWCPQNVIKAMWRLVPFSSLVPTPNLNFQVIHLLPWPPWRERLGMLDGFHGSVPQGRYLAWKEGRGRQSAKESSSFLVVRESKVVQTFFFWVVLVMCPSWSSGAILGEVTWRNLWKSYRGYKGIELVDYFDFCYMVWFLNVSLFESFMELRNLDWSYNAIGGWIEHKGMLIYILYVSYYL